MQTLGLIGPALAIWRKRIPSCARRIRVSYFYPRGSAPIQTVIHYSFFLLTPTGSTEGGHFIVPINCGHYCNGRFAKLALIFHSGRFHSEVFCVFNVFIPPSVLMDTVNYHTTMQYPDTGPHGAPDISLVSLEYRLLESHIGLTSCRSLLKMMRCSVFLRCRRCT